ncbi:MAG: type II secretion system F family protein, partial [Candidatus Kariarchaeaceae archaeon]
MYFEKKYKIAVYILSFLVFIMFLSLLIIQKVYVITPPYFIPISREINNSIGLGLIIAFLFPAFIEFNNSKWLKSVDDNTPRLLLDITETVRTGVPLMEALKDAATRDYGPVSEKLSSALLRFRLSSNLKDALNRLSADLFRPVVRNMNTLLLEAYKMGG